MQPLNTVVGFSLRAIMLYFLADLMRVKVLVWTLISPPNTHTMVSGGTLLS